MEQEHVPSFQELVLQENMKWLNEDKFSSHKKLQQLVSARNKTRKSIQPSEYTKNCMLDVQRRMLLTSIDGKMERISKNPVGKLPQDVIPQECTHCSKKKEWYSEKEGLCHMCLIRLIPDSFRFETKEEYQERIKDKKEYTEIL